MTKRIAVLWCCLSLAQGSVVAAEDLIERRPVPLTTAVGGTARQMGPRRPTSLVNAAHALLREEATRAIPPLQDCEDRGTWMERHPVWAGAMVGFGTGVLLTYAVTHDNNEGELLKVMSPGAGALIWGSVSAGVGALAGWGIGRNRNDGGGVCGG
ncbi:MAG: hypothetical protein JJE40_13505 [Vicinamibacteria bacterium]|nr:hypothetical protein [Vicinamibacteria bacterium]